MAEGKPGKKGRPGARPAEGSKSRKRNSPISLISLVLVLISLIFMFVLCLIPDAGENSGNPTLVILSEKRNLPSLALKNVLHATGFQYEARRFNDGLPSGDIVILAVGDNALSVINEYKDNERVLGFILVCPSFNDADMDGLSRISPVQDVAIFAGRDDPEGVPDMGDARIIYERLSGDDTIYGTSIKRGGLFSSEVFVNNSQDRMLSLSFFDVKRPEKLLFSPLFQNELAGYLSVTYMNYISKVPSFGRINSWVILSIFAFALTAVSILLYLSGMRVYIRKLKALTSSVPTRIYIVTGVISLIISLFVVISGVTGRSIDSSAIMTVLSPAVFGLGLYINNFGSIHSKDGKIIPARKTFIPSVILSSAIGIFALLTAILTSDLSFYVIEDSGLAAAFIIAVAVIDTIIATGLIYAYRKALVSNKFPRPGAGVLSVIIIMLLPSLLSCVFGAVSGQAVMYYAGLGSLAAAVIPAVCIFPLVRHTDRSLIPGILHGVLYVIILAAVL